MKTQFLTMKQKALLMTKVSAGFENDIKFMFDEINRLEAVIRDYESAIELISLKLESKTFKEPDKIP